MGGASRYQAADIIDVSERTLKRWRSECGTVVEDQRPQAAQGRQPHQLTHEEKQTILNTCHRPEYQSLPPSQIVPLLADRCLSGLRIVVLSGFEKASPAAPSWPYETTPSSARADQFYGNRAKPGLELGH